MNVSNSVGDELHEETTIAPAAQPFGRLKIELVT